ncbi:MAG: glutathione S-transferase family protein [Sphingomonadaceae bacterium]
MTITLYQFEISPYADKVRRALRYKDLAFEVVEVLVSKRNAHKAVSPTGKFPALVHDGRTIVDSSDILRYLDRTFPKPQLAPDSPRDAALATILEDWADESLYFYDLTMRPWPQNRAWFVSDLLAHEKGLARAVLAKAIPGAIAKVAAAQGLGRKRPDVVVSDLTALYDALDGWLDGETWLAGPRLSSADIAVRVMVNVLDRTVEGARLRAERVRLDQWCRRVDEAAPPEGLSITKR